MKTAMAEEVPVPTETPTVRTYSRCSGWIGTGMVGSWHLWKQKLFEYLSPTDMFHLYNLVTLLVENLETARGPATLNSHLWRPWMKASKPYKMENPSASWCIILEKCGNNNNNIYQKSWFQTKEPSLQPWAEVWTSRYPIQVMRSVMDITPFWKRYLQ